MDSNIDFGELVDDESFKTKILDFIKNLNEVTKTVENFFSDFTYDDLTVEDKVRYDLFMAFALNTLYWIYLRTKGVDPNNHEIKHQINRIREYMNKSKKIYEKKTLMPHIDQGAAKRFIKSGLWAPKSSTSIDSTLDAASPKRLKTSDSNDEEIIEKT